MPKHDLQETDTQREPSFWTSTQEIAKQPTTTAISEMWVGLEPTFSSRKTVKLWRKMAVDPEGEVAFFSEPTVLRKQRKLANRIRDSYRAAVEEGDDACMFDAVRTQKAVDPWGVERRELEFRQEDDCEFEVKVGIDPETYEFNLKPVPLLWLYEPRFVRFLQQFVWDSSEATGLAPSIAHGGGQFSFSAKTYLTGSLLADDVASRLDHPELSTWILDYPNPDDRAFRATRARKAAFEAVLASYRAGGFHPKAIGRLTVANAILDRGFAASPNPPAGLMEPARGPIGSAEDVFRTNFAFARCMRVRAQGVDPGYWQSVSMEEDGYRTDQIPRYSEANAHRIQIAGERHVKSGEVLCEDRIPEFDALLERSHLYDEASWEIRGQMARTSAADFVDAVLLDVHHAAWLKENPHVIPRASILQDQLHGEAIAVLQQRDPKRLGKLRKKAREANLAASEGRIRSDWIEPEVLFWAAWDVLPSADRAAIASEAILGFLERVENAATQDPRPGAGDDPMERHRHRIHPVLWDAIAAHPHDAPKEVRWESGIWRDQREALEARRPQWSVVDKNPPWGGK